MAENTAEVKLQVGFYISCKNLSECTRGPEEVDCISLFSYSLAGVNQGRLPGEKSNFQSGAGGAGRKGGIPEPAEQRRRDREAPQVSWEPELLLASPAGEKTGKGGHCRVILSLVRKALILI